ncbi:MAG: 30S ribosomal protein S3ae [Thermoproteales archaeon]|nr:30S ribosomal protein S3ae [Thermoproteales archaeon]
MSSLSRAAREKWAAKKWYTVYAPSAFGFAELGEVPANSDKHLLGRVMEVSLYDITKDISQLHIKLKFQIVKIEGNKAYTQFKGFELSRDYIREIVRRGTSKVEGIYDVFTKDGVHLRVFVLTITTHRVKSSQKKAIRKVAGEVVERKASELNFDEFIQEAVLGQIAAEVFTKARKIYSLRKVEISKVKTLSRIFEISLKTPSETQAQVPAEAGGSE